MIERRDGERGGGAFPFRSGTDEESTRTAHGTGRDVALQLMTAAFRRRHGTELHRAGRAARKGRRAGQGESFNRERA